MYLGSCIGIRSA